MAKKQEVAAYVSALIEELVQMCREAGLSDLEVSPVGDRCGSGEAA